MSTLYQVGRGVAGQGFKGVIRSRSSGRALVCREEETQRRSWTLAATATATIVLAASTVSLAVWWSQHAGAPQSAAPGIENASDARAQRGTHRSEGVTASLHGGATPGALPQARRRGWSWTTYENGRFSFALKYPADVFVFDTGPPNDNVRTLVSHDGGAMLHIFAAENVAGTTLAKYRQSLIEQRYSDVVLDHTRLRKFWFVLSGTRGDAVFYERVTFSCDGRAIHGWQMIYPLNERTLYDLVADEVNRNYTHTSGPGTRCGEAKPRSSQASGPPDRG